jgi:hypothetical protein
MIECPIVQVNGKAVIGQPPENVLTILLINFTTLTSEDFCHDRTGSLRADSILQPHWPNR